METAIVIKFVICMIPLAILWVLSIMLVKAKNGNLKFSFQKNYLKQIDALSLGSNSSIHLVQVSEDEVLLLGVSANNTNCLQTYKVSQLKPLAKDEGLDLKNLLSQIQVNKIAS